MLDFLTTLLKWLAEAPIPVQITFFAGFFIVVAIFVVFAFRDQSIHGAIDSWVKTHIGSEPKL